MPNLSTKCSCCWIASHFVKKSVCELEVDVNRTRGWLKLKVCWPLGDLGDGTCEKIWLSKESKVRKREYKIGRVVFGGKKDLGDWVNLKGKIVS